MTATPFHAALATARDLPVLRPYEDADGRLLADCPNCGLGGRVRRRPDGRARFDCFADCGASGIYPIADTGGELSRQPALDFLPLQELRARVRERGPRRWLLRGLWPEGAYGVHAAEMKAQKSWNALDLAVSVASATPWLGHIPVDAPGRVLLFWGEGDDASLIRRLDAICDDRALDPDSLPITVCCRAPHLGDSEHRAEFDRQVNESQPQLVILDPFYLAARGANGADLYAMGELLEHPQRTCVAVGAALFVVHHFNRKEGRGAARITGAGPAEWGRVLIASTVKSRRTDPDTRATTVITELDCIGGEIPDRTLRVTRTVSADDPDDLDSPLRYRVSVTEVDGEAGDLDGVEDMPPARRKLLEALRAAPGPRAVSQLVDWIADEHGHGLRRQTASTELNALLRDGLADCVDQGEGRPKLWFATEPEVSA